MGRLSQIITIAWVPIRGMQREVTDRRQKAEGSVTWNQRKRFEDSRLPVLKMEEGTMSQDMRL